MTPLLSVLVPTYNGAGYLSETLASIFAQSCADFEVVVSDDASTDATLEILRAQDDPRLRLLAQDSRAGLAGNWNRCLAAARGRYCALVGQDDLLERHWAARLVDLLEAHPEADLAFGRRRIELADDTTRAALGVFFEEKYPEMLAPFYAEIDRSIPVSTMVRAAMRDCFEINLIGEPSFTMVRREHPATLAGYDGRFGQLLDWEFASRFFADRPVLHCAEELGTYRVHTDGASFGNASMLRHYGEYLQLLDVIEPRLAHRLDAAQRQSLAARRLEVQGLAAALRGSGG